MSKELVCAARSGLTFAKANLSPSGQMYRYLDQTVPALCDALEEANERIRELEEQVQTYMEFPYTVPKQR